MLFAKISLVWDIAHCLLTVFAIMKWSPISDLNRLIVA